MRWRMALLSLAGVVGISAIAGFLLWNAGRSAAQRVDYPTVLSNLFPGRTDNLGDIAVDDAGMVWFPVLHSTRDDRSNSVYRYDPAHAALKVFPLPNDPGMTYTARIEAGSGPRQEQMLVGWGSTLVEVDRSTGEVHRIDLPFDLDHILPAFAGSPDLPSITAIRDIAIDKQGTIWVARDSYGYLIAISGDGAEREIPLPAEAGSLDRLALDAHGRVWATLFNHPPVPRSGGGLQWQSAFTLRFDPETEHFDVLPWDAWSIVGGSKVIATGGDDAAAVRRFDVPGSTPLGVAEFGAEGRGAAGAEAAVGPRGDVWYYSYDKLSLIRLEDSGQNVFPLPTYAISEYKCRGHFAVTTPDPGCYELVTTADPVNGIAIAPDGSAWFSAADRIGHAVP